ncbi:MAG: amino acid racemase [Tissierellia bacterium]|nr:amino acid racemase [Tissierellia bacterium]
MGKKLGIIGGMGPLATVKLFEMIVLMTRAKSDQEHIHILVDNNTSIPDRTDYILNRRGEDPRIQLIESAKRLEKMGADFLVMPCNTAHHFYDDIVNNINIPFIHMIEETAKYIRERYPAVKKIGLLATDGTIKAEIYHEIFNRYHIEVLTPKRDYQKYVMDLIYNIKEDVVQNNLDGFYKAMDDLKEQGAELYVAGCTEVSVAIELFNLEGEIVDAMKVLAIRAIERVGKEAKDM